MVDNLLNVGQNVMFSDVTHSVDVIMAPENAILQVHAQAVIFTVDTTSI